MSYMSSGKGADFLTHSDDASQEADLFRPPLTISRGDFLRSGRDDHFRETIYILVRGLERLIACREAFGRHLGLTASQFTVLVGTAYRQGDQGVTIRDLAAHISLAQTHVTTEVGRLIRRGLLVKRPNAADGRSVLVSLTSEGETAVEAVSPLVREVNDILFEGISAQDMEAARGFMLKLLANSELTEPLLRAAGRDPR